MNGRQSSIVAIVTMQKQAILSGGAPVFVVSTYEELQQMSSRLEAIMDASAHELDQVTMIIVAR